ncbi:MAG: protein kinase [Thermodesulfobacteriota bacterium]
MGDIEKLGKYTIQSILGQGAMGVVYKGFDPSIERTVAIKAIRKDAFQPEEMEQLLARFKREAQAAGRLTHPGIVTVYEYAEDGDNAFIAMEYVPGRELQDFLDKNERFPLNTVIDIVTQLLDALIYSHAQGVVHRDIKPSNIILLGNGQIKIMDFGIAKIESSTLTQFGDIFGTPSYMSPEQFSGQPVDKRSDLYSTGVILYHMLTGEKPFHGNSITSIMHRVMTTEAPLVSDINIQVPSSLDEVVRKALARKLDKRFQTAKEFKAALTKKSLVGETVAADLSGKTNVELREMCAAAGIIGISKKNKKQLIAALKDAVNDGSTVLKTNLASEEIATVATQRVDTTGNHVARQEKFDKTTDLLESQGVATKEVEQQLSGKGRKLALTILVVTILAIFSFTAWTMYSEDLTYQELEQIVKEKAKDISAAVADQFITTVKEKAEDISASFSDQKTTIVKEKAKDTPAAVADQKTTIVKEKAKDIPPSLSGQNRTVVEISKSLKHKPTK